MPKQTEINKPKKIGLAPSRKDDNRNVRAIFIKWVSMDDAISLLFPLIVKSLDETKNILLSDEIDKAVDKRTGNQVFFLISILKYIRKRNEAAFIEKGSEAIIQEAAVAPIMDMSGAPVKSTHTVFDKLSLYKTPMNFKHPKPEKEIDLNTYDTYRAMFGMMMFRPLIDKTFMAEHNLRPQEFRAIMFVSSLRYFALKDLFNAQGAITISYKKVLEGLLKKGLITLHKSGRNDFDKVYVVTNKCMSLAIEYVEYITFKRKLKMIRPHTRPEITVSSMSKRKADDSKYIIGYSYYTYAFENVNIIETENPLGYRRSEIDLFFREGNKLAMFSPLMYVKMIMLLSQGKLNSKNTLTYVKRNMAKNVFSDSGFSFQFNPKLKRKHLHQLNEVNSEEVQELIEEFVTLNKDYQALRQQYYPPIKGMTLLEKEQYYMEKGLFERDEQLFRRFLELRRGAIDEMNNDGLFIN